MSVSAINNDVSGFLLKSSSAVSDQSAKGSASTVLNATTQLQEPSPSVNNGKIPSSPAPNLAEGVDSHDKPVRTMSHVVEVYDQQGNVRIKFMDGNNKVIYQIPSEIVAKMKDQMMRPEASASLEG